MNRNESGPMSLQDTWDRLLTLTGRMEGRLSCARMIHPLITITCLLCGALTISPMTWLNVLCTDAGMLNKTTGWVRIVAEKWMALGLYDHYGKLCVSLALFVMVVPLMVGLLAHLLLLPLRRRVGKRSTEQLPDGEIQQLQRIKDMSTGAGCRMRKDYRALSWRMAWIGSIVLGGLSGVAWAISASIRDGNTASDVWMNVLLGVLFGVLMACAYLILFLPAWYLTGIRVSRTEVETVEAIRTDAEQQLAQQIHRLEQEERERKASEVVRRKQEKEARIQRILKEADGLFAQKKFAEAMKAYQPLAEELVPRGRAGYLLSRVAAVRNPVLKECRPIAEELRKLEKMELPLAVKKACREVADGLTAFIREQCGPRFYRAQELIHLGMDTSALQTLKEISELGMPEAVPVYVATAVKLDASREEYPAFIQLLDMANQLGFSVTAAKHAYRVMQPKLNYDYGRHLVDRGMKADGESYIRVAAEMGEERAIRYQMGPSPVATYSKVAKNEEDA